MAFSRYFLVQGLLLWMALGGISSECPWPRESRELAPLSSTCICALNLKNEYSIQCSGVNFPLLMRAVHRRSIDVQFDLLYVNNSLVDALEDRTFYGLRVRNIQMSFCNIKNISFRAFEGLENSLENLNLQDNKLPDVPTRALAGLAALKLLDLSSNKITQINRNAFIGLQISTLKLSDNDVSVYPSAFAGLENHLKNLNLKSCNLPSLPKALTRLSSLAFLDLAENEIRHLRPGSLSSLDSLTALNLERNLLQELKVDAFEGVTDTLSSLSLLSNLLTTFPLEAINSLPHLRVLDIGFNLISKIPDDAFREIRSLTLLAVDGNPLSSIPQRPFTHLNGVLRGLSLGGKYLICDCRVAWITKWIAESDLQVTSRDREPQFCGSPFSFRERSFYDILPDEFVCNGTSELRENKVQMLEETQSKEYFSLDGKTSEEAQISKTKDSTKIKDKIEEKENAERNQIKPSKSTPSLPPPPIEKSTTTSQVTLPSTTAPSPKATTTKRPVKGSVLAHSPSTRNANSGHVSLQSGPVRVPLPKNPLRAGIPSNVRTKRPPLVLRPQDPRLPDGYYSKREQESLFGEEVIVQDAYWADDSISIMWDTEVSNILGFRVVYRLFGNDYFKMAQPLSPTKREFKIKNVPANEYFVVCVVSLEEMDIKPENVPFNQCREIRTGTSRSMLSTHMDTIIIAASAAICGTVIIAVVVFICCNRGRRKSQPEKQGIPAILSHSSPPLASLGALGGSTKTDWDTLSMYSQRSIPRARMYNYMDKEDTRSHVSHMSSKSRPRSHADGQSQRSFTGLSGVHLPGGGAFVSPLALSRPGSRTPLQPLPLNFMSHLANHKLMQGTAAVVPSTASHVIPSRIIWISNPQTSQPFSAKTKQKHFKHWPKTNNLNS